MLNFWLLTKKNLRLLLRAKWSALIVFLAPLLLILILGLTFNTSSQYGLTIGVHSSEFTADVQQLTASLEAQNFTIKEFPSSVDTCVEEISEGLVHTCLVVPPSLQVSDNIAKEVIFYLDPSNINLVWMVQQTLESEFSLQSQQLAEQLGQDTLSRITSAKDKVTTQNGVLGNVNSQTNSAVSAAGTAKDSLSTINVVVGNATYNVSFIDEAKLGITSGKSKLSDAKDVVEDANLSGTAQSNILSAINSAETQFETVLATLNNDSSITSLLSELESMRTRLSQAASAISESNNNLATTTSALQEVQSSLNGVTSALQEVQSVLEGQQITDAATLTAPLNVRVETVAPQGTYLNYLFPGLLVLVIMFTSLLLGTTLVMMEKNSPAFLRNFFAPVSKVTFITSTYLTNLFLILIEIIIILLVSLVFLKSGLASFPAVALVLFLAASIFTFLGMIIGYVFANEETGILAAISLGNVLLFLSGMIFPLEGISPALRSIAAFNPFVIAESVIRELFIFGSSLGSVWMELLILLAYTVVLFLIILLLESLLHQHLVERFLRHHQKKHKRKAINKKNTK